MFKLTVAVVAGALLSARPILAQSCVETCVVNSIAPVGCTSIDDFQCICEYQDIVLPDITDCVTDRCLDGLEDPQSVINNIMGSCGGGFPPEIETEEETTTTPTTRGTGTATRPTASSTPRTTGTSSAPTTSSTSSTGAGFHTASIASGVTVALFGAALSLF